MDKHNCTDCGGEAHIYRDDAYGEGNRGAWYCDLCYASDYFPDTMRIDAWRLGVGGEIIFVPDDARCVNCDAHILPHGAIKSKDWDKAVEAHEHQGEVVMSRGSVQTKYWTIYDSPTPATHWAYQVGDMWAAVEEWELDQGWFDADFDPSPWMWRTIDDVPKFGTLRYSSSNGEEVITPILSRTSYVTQIMQRIGSEGEKSYGGKPHEFWLHHLSLKSRMNWALNSGVVTQEEYDLVKSTYDEDRWEHAE